MNEAKSNPNLTPGDGFVDVTLSKPVTVDGAELQTVRMREPLAGDVETVGAIENGGTREVMLFANLCMLSPAQVRALPFRDYGRLQAAFAHFTD